MKTPLTLLVLAVTASSFAQGRAPLTHILEMGGFSCPVVDVSGGQESSDLIDIINPLPNSIVNAMRPGKAKYKNIILKCSPPSSTPLMQWIAERCRGGYTGAECSLWAAGPSGDGLLEESFSGALNSFTYPACSFGRGPRQTTSIDGSFSASFSAKVITDRDTGRSKGFGRLGGKPNADWITNTCAIRMDKMNTDGVVSCDPITVSFSPAPMERRRWMCHRST